MFHSNYGPIFNSVSTKPKDKQRVIIHLQRGEGNYRATFYASVNDSVEHFRDDDGEPVFGHQKWSMENFK